MNYKKAMKSCIDFFNELAIRLSDTYEVIKSCNNDSTLYLVPKGTSDQISYYGKPAASFRVSDHWNWLASTKKCSDPNYVQCRSLDMPWRRMRTEEGKATKPMRGPQVAFYGEDGCYHCIFGDKFDRKTKTWSWQEASVDDVIAACF